jgi:hypothetical protein
VFDEDFVAGFDQSFDTCRGDPDAAFVILYFLGYADDHAYLQILLFDCIQRDGWRRIGGDGGEAGTGFVECSAEGPLAVQYAVRLDFQE